MGSREPPGRCEAAAQTIRKSRTRNQRLLYRNNKEVLQAGIFRRIDYLRRATGAIPAIATPLSCTRATVAPIRRRIILRTTA